MPTAWVMDPDREPMIAVKMNDEPLPPGARLSRRGSSSPGCTATCRRRSGSTELELTTLEAFDGYWVPARLGQGGADPDAVAHRHAALRRRRRRRARPDRRASPGRRTAASARSRSASTATWQRRASSRARSRTRPGSSGWPTGTPRPASTTIPVRATDGTGETQTEQRDAAGPRRRPRLAHDPGVIHGSADGPLGPRRFRYRVRA